MKKWIRFGLSVMLVPLIDAKDVSVSWLKAPPEKIGPDHVIDVAWKVEGLDSDYRALVTICPFSLGANCKKGPERQDGHMFTSNDKGEYQDQIQITPKKDGQYYIVAYGALSKKKFYNTEPIVVEYNSNHKQEKNAQEIPVTEEHSEADENNNSSGSVIIVPPHPVPYGYPYPTPYPYPYGYPDADDRYEEREENYDQRQENRDQTQENRDQRQENHGAGTDRDRRGGRQDRNHQERGRRH